MEEESCCVPPGFRFHPTEEELVGYYLARKVASHKIDLDIIQEVDLYRIEPWDLQERCKLQHGGGVGQDEQSMMAECYFFSHKDRKYPSGTRTNRATASGFWKATGRDKPVLSSSSSGGRVIGMRKTLVFYKGRAPNGRKTEWIIHEYRLHHHHAPVAQEEGWVVCRAFHKPVPSQRSPFFPSYGAAAPTAAGYYYENARLQHLAGGDHHHLLGSALHPAGGNSGGLFPKLYAADDFEYKSLHHLFSIPQTESPTADGYSVAQRSSNNDTAAAAENGELAAGAIDWNFLDTLLSSSTASQLHEPSTTLLQ